jgi:hypothetical protein
MTRYRHRRMQPNRYVTPSQGHHVEATNVTTRPQGHHFTRLLLTAVFNAFPTFRTQWTTGWRLAPSYCNRNTFPSINTRKRETKSRNATFAQTSDHLATHSGHRNTTGRSEIKSTANIKTQDNCRTGTKAELPQQANSRCVC